MPSNARLALAGSGGGWPASPAPLREKGCPMSRVLCETWDSTVLSPWDLRLAGGQHLPPRYAKKGAPCLAAFARRGIPQSHASRVLLIHPGGWPASPAPLREKGCPMSRGLCETWDSTVLISLGFALGAWPASPAPLREKGCPMSRGLCETWDSTVSSPWDLRLAGGPHLPPRYAKKGAPCLAAFARRGIPQSHASRVLLIHPALSRTLEPKEPTMTIEIRGASLEARIQKQLLAAGFNSAEEVLLRLESQSA